jgi:acetyl-CoA acyltransferase
MAKTNRRVAIVGGLRTPFVKAGTDFKDVPVLDLSSTLVSEMIERLHLDPNEVGQLVFGSVIPDLRGPNLAREIVLRTRLPESTDAFSVSRACATSTQAIVNGAQSIMSGDADVVIAGGAEAMSKPPITVSDHMAAALMEASSARDPMSKAKAMSSLRPKDLVPSSLALEERSTGMTMGQSAEKMARENGITRQQQDEYTLASHQKATEAWEKGVYEQEVMPYAVAPRFSKIVERDGIPRADTSLEKLAGLKPVFDRKYGTLTAGNSSPLTDGAAAVVLMEAGRAKALGFEPLAHIRTWGFAALDPGWQLLMGPSFATPKALDKAGMTLDDIDVIDMHEAFAAQVLSNLAAFSSTDWAKQHLGRDKAIGEVDPDKLNPYGGSISLGHPFGATGARQVLTMANELVRRDKGTALITQCAAGGLGATVILER